MKKVISVLVLIALSLSLATSCNLGSRKAKSVLTKSILYSSRALYLYEFEDAVIDGEYKPADENEITPTKSGFVFSTEELEKGEEITVWKNVIFESSSEFDWSGDPKTKSSTEATVKKCVKMYPILVEDKGQTFLITYYDSLSETYSTKEAALKKEPEKHTIEIGKANVFIEYFD